MSTTDTSLRRRSRSLTEAVVESLTRQIRSGAYAVGAKLPTEAVLMQQEGVSRTVIREAISRLQAAGLVETRHGIGTFVRQMDRIPGAELGQCAPARTLLDVVAVLELRIAVESEAAALAAMRRSDADLQKMVAALDAFDRVIEAPQGQSIEPDRAFHAAIAHATGNAYFTNILGQLGQAIIPRTRINLSHLNDAARVEYLRYINREHRVVLAAIERRDPESARAAMRTHLSNSRERLRAAYDRLPDQAKSE
ncbi:GntR family transcriptional regulator [Lampropedia cohaerens]|uniref:GntR family transcriptional regulator n=1 Tax=Lampropedia cohaerens TaxID=1610491 RepID=A0A0U1PZ19_9BURK|nr:FadR/GntR family transcriptional regulator [Lampropedia cohaerens]KKW67772.1 GntR family transcriptional regulator [Lampropedia cohaerens]